MARFYVPQSRIESGKVTVKGSEVKHIRNVLRLKAGDWITVFNGSAMEYQGPIVEMDSSSVVIQVENATLTKRDSDLEITLAQSLLKGEKMDYLVQKATELGVSDIIPFFSARSVPRLERSKRTERHHRWEKIVVESSKQCGRGILPRIKFLQEYSEMLESSSPDALRLILWEKEGIALKEVLTMSTRGRKLFFVVGPEGGLSHEEVREARDKGFIAITLGKRILRAETASLYLLSILQYEWGDMG